MLPLAAAAGAFALVLIFRHCRLLRAKVASGTTSTTKVSGRSGGQSPHKRRGLRAGFGASVMEVNFGSDGDSQNDSTHEARAPSTRYGRHGRYDGYCQNDSTHEARAQHLLRPLRPLRRLLP